MNHLNPRRMFVDISVDDLDTPLSCREYQSSIACYEATEEEIKMLLSLIKKLQKRVKTRLEAK